MNDAGHVYCGLLGFGGMRPSLVRENGESVRAKISLKDKIKNLAYIINQQW
jgi:hypothetical protein